MEAQNSKVKSIVSILDEINDSLIHKDNDLDILRKEKEYLNNLVSLNKFDLENIEDEKASLRKQCKALQENDYKCQTELQDLKLKLLDIEKTTKQEENLLNTKYQKKIEELQDKLDRSEVIISQYSLEIEELSGLNKIGKRQIEDLEQGRMSTKDYMQNHVKKDNYNSLNDKYKQLQDKENSMQIMVEELYSEVNKYSSNRLNLNFEQHISHISMKFKQLENEIVLLKTQQKQEQSQSIQLSQQPQKQYTHNNSELSEEEKRLKRNLGL